MNLAIDDSQLFDNKQIVRFYNQGNWSLDEIELSIWLPGYTSRGRRDSLVYPGALLLRRLRGREGGTHLSPFIRSQLLLTRRAAPQSSCDTILYCGAVVYCGAPQLVMKRRN